MTTDDPTFALLERIATAVEGLRADLRRHRSHDRDALNDLVVAIEQEFGDAPFTTHGLLDLADEESYGPVGAALCRLIDLESPTRAERLGRVLASLPDFERDHRRGVSVFRCRSPRQSKLW